MSFCKESNKLVGATTCPKFGCQEYGRYRRDFPKLKKDNNNKRKREEAHVTQEVKEDDKKQKKEDPPRTKSTSLLKVFFQRG